MGSVGSGDTVVAALLFAFVAVFTGYLLRALSGSAARTDEPGPAEEAGSVDQPLPLNTVNIAERVYLRVTTEYGHSLHLACKRTEWGGRGPRSAVAIRQTDQGLRNLCSYDADELLFPMWTRRTLCGLRWKEMADHLAEVSAIVSSLTDEAPTNYVCDVCAGRAVITWRNQLV
jgi:hypothetical protein